MATLEVVEGDLLDQPVLVIVNAQNRNPIPWWLLLPQGFQGRSRNAAAIRVERKAFAGLADESIRLDVATIRNYIETSMELEWDAAKAARNLSKHGISFEDAELVFYDTGRIETYDGRDDYGEDRWATIGLAYSAVLYVVYTVRHEDTIRLISARKANANERKHYREANA